MAESRTIETLLSCNSGMPNSLGTTGLVRATLKTQYRPDKLFVRDEFMKWDMIYNNIDTPHRLANGAVLTPIDRVQLRTELAELDENFKI